MRLNRLIAHRGVDDIEDEKQSNVKSLADSWCISKKPWEWANLILADSRRLHEVRLELVEDRGHEGELAQQREKYRGCEANNQNGKTGGLLVACHILNDIDAGSYV
jgi:hypothetical protein